MDLAYSENQPVIVAGIYDLRPLRPSDAGLMTLYTSDLRVAQTTSSIAHPLPPGATEAFIARSLAADRIEDAWAIDGTRAESGELVGVISLTRLDVDQSEIGYWVAPLFWNSGVASAAVGAGAGNCRLISTISWSRRRRPMWWIDHWRFSVRLGFRKTKRARVILRFRSVQPATP